MDEKITLEKAETEKPKGTPPSPCRFRIEGFDAARCSRFTVRRYQIKGESHCAACIMEAVLVELRAAKKTAPDIKGG